MPSKSAIVLPYLDPEFSPTHPANNPPVIEEDKYLPLSKRRRAQLEQEALAEALQEWTPPHVLRLYETDAERARRRTNILSLHLSPKLPELSDLIPQNKHDSSLSRTLSTSDPTDFRNFAHDYLHLGFHRVHAFGTLPEEDDTSVPPEEICWIMEYTTSECNVIRRRLAWAMGEFPAVIDQDSPLYDGEVAWRYERRLYCRCRRRTQSCIRPSHVEIFTSTGPILP